MFFFFTCGTHMFQSLLKGQEGVTAQCQNCGNFSARVYKRWEWFTFCFVPLIPFSFKPYHELGCHICNFYQDVKYRPDIEQGQQTAIPMKAQQGAAPGGPPGGANQPLPQYK